LTRKIDFITQTLNIVGEVIREGESCMDVANFSSIPKEIN
jgi:hypothetical protein